MRNLKKNVYATSYFIFLIGIIVLMFTMLLVSHFALGGTAIYSQSSMQYPIVWTDAYDDMSEDQRREYLDNYNGCFNTIVFINPFDHSDYNVTFGHLAYLWHCNGAIMLKADYDKFINGDADDPDWQQVLKNIATINIPILDHLGIVGVAIRVIFAITLGVIVWLLLPFTG